MPSEVNVWSLAFLDSKTLAVGSDRRVDLWDLDAVQFRQSFPQQSPVRALACSPDGRLT